MVTNECFESAAASASTHGRGQCCGGRDSRCRWSNLQRKAETDVIKQQCINTEKEIQALIAADSKQMIGSFVNWESIRLAIFIVESSV